VIADLAPFTGIVALICTGFFIETESVFLICAFIVNAPVTSMVRKTIFFMLEILWCKTNRAEKALQSLKKMIFIATKALRHETARRKNHGEPPCPGVFEAFFQKNH
jgi:hypothetical protein